MDQQMQIEFEHWKIGIISRWPAENRESVERLFFNLENDIASYPGIVKLKIFSTPRISEEKNASIGLCDTYSPNEVTISLGIGDKTDATCLEYFFHECCHFKQHLDYLNGTPHIKKNVDDDLMDIHEGGDTPFEETSPETKAAYIRAMEFELDCNQRVLRLFELVQFDFDKVHTIKGMNAYHMSQLAFYDYKSFYIHDPANDETILRAMPTRLLNVDELIKAYDRDLFVNCFV